MSSTLSLLPETDLDEYANPLTLDVPPAPLPQKATYWRGPATSSALIGTANRDQRIRSAIEAVREYRRLADNWDKYGGTAIEQRPAKFALQLLNEIWSVPKIPAPSIRPISTGVFLEWRIDKDRLYFEVDQESVMRYSNTVYGEETVVDESFDSKAAFRAVLNFLEKAA